MRKIGSATVFLALVLLLQSCAAGKYAVNAQYPQVRIDGTPQGILEEVLYPSSEPGMVERRAYVYLPKGYYDSVERYPVLYLLHGARGNECAWMEKGNLLHNIDSLSASGAMLPTIVVLPNANQYNDAGDYGKARPKSALESFFEIDGTVESRFVTDVVASTDSLFRTIPDKAHRALAGMSIGAMQSIHISANSPDTFNYVGIFSPMVNSFMKAGPDNGFYRKLNEKQAVQFQNPPRLYLVMIGTTDFFENSITEWDRQLTRKGYPHEFQMAPGGHEWYNWEEFCNQFIQRLWK